MKVYTRKGDSGTTQLIGGERVSKDHARIDAYGTIDELNSHMGLIAYQPECRKHLEQIISIQNTLFTIGSILAEQPGGSNMELPTIGQADIDQIEAWIDGMDESLEPLKSFVLPGGHDVVSMIHIARCVCRRAERAIVRVYESEEGDELVLAYVNRLSDGLFVFARWISKQVGAKEIPWQPRG